MSEFTVRGTFQTHRGDRTFETTIEAENEDVAVEHAYANYGSQHNLKRAQIEISEVEGR